MNNHRELFLLKPAGFENRFERTLIKSGHKVLSRARLSELQLNLGRLCNQACNHCHVDAGPKRTEVMTQKTMDRILAWSRENNLGRVDITGGAPEMNPHFRYLVDQFLDLDWSVTSRCNLTILTEAGQEGLAEFYAERNIRLVSSLPCYTRENVDQQRGKGVFSKSIRALQELNRLGYGSGAERVLDLVYNPGGPFLPPSQQQLEADYRRKLLDDFGIRFNRLLTITNLPISRFLHVLKRTGKTDEYFQLLTDNFNATTIDALMCRHLVSVDWEGRLYDCDFNQMLDMNLGGTADRGQATFLWETRAHSFEGMPIATDDHCLGCTAGAGSSCGGALA